MNNELNVLIYEQMSDTENNINSILEDIRVLNFVEDIREVNESIDMFAKFKEDKILSRVFKVLEVARNFLLELLKIFKANIYKYSDNKTILKKFKKEVDEKIGRGDLDTFVLDYEIPKNNRITLTFFDSLESHIKFKDQDKDEAINNTYKAFLGGIDCKDEKEFKKNLKNAWFLEKEKSTYPNIHRSVIESLEKSNNSSEVDNACRNVDRYFSGARNTIKQLLDSEDGNVSEIISVISAIQTACSRCISEYTNMYNMENENAKKAFLAAYSYRPNRNVKKMDESVDISLLEEFTLESEEYLSIYEFAEEYNKHANTIIIDEDIYDFNK